MDVITYPHGKELETLKALQLPLGFQVNWKKSGNGTTVLENPTTGEEKIITEVRGHSDPARHQTNLHFRAAN